MSNIKKLIESKTPNSQIVKESFKHDEDDREMYKEQFNDLTEMKKDLDSIKKTIDKIKLDGQGWSYIGSGLHKAFLATYKEVEESIKDAKENME